jgi:shikimate 5-dehydrogenase
MTGFLPTLAFEVRVPSTTSFREWRIGHDVSVGKYQPLNLKRFKRCAEAICNTVPTGMKVKNKKPIDLSAFRAGQKASIIFDGNYSHFSRSDSQNRFVG